MFRWFSILFCVIGLSFLNLAWAQSSGYPIKPISVVVAYPPGGDTDAIARLFSEKLGQALKQSVVVDNKAGAGGVVGNAFVAKASPDGYTLLFTPNPFTTAPMVMGLSSAASYDVLNGFEPIIKTAVQPLVLVAHPSANIKSISEMIAVGKAGKNISYASPGSGSPMHIIAEWLNKESGVQITHIPYKGVGPSVTDVVAGHVNTAWVTLGPVTQYFAQNRLFALAIGDAQRSSLNSSIPTLVESGYKDVVVGAWNGFLAPKGTPRDVVKLINKHLNDIIKDPEVVQKLANFGALPSGGDPESLGITISNEYQTMSKLIKDLKISAN